MKTLALAAFAVAFATLSLPHTVRADDETPSVAQPTLIADGVHSPVTHLLEVINAPILQASKTDTVHGTLAERPSPARHSDTALNGK
jgi:hypothetical protein